jgi:metal-responsive CopG/Arc/MetJ family transcriptional regulator
MPTPRKITAFRLDEDLLEGLQVIWERDGVQPSETVRRALRAWLEAKGVGSQKKRPPVARVTRRKA